MGVSKDLMFEQRDADEIIEKAVDEHAFDEEMMQAIAVLEQRRASGGITFEEFAAAMKALEDGAT